MFGPRSTDYDFGPGHPLDAASIRAGDRPAPGGRGGARPGTRAGHGRGAGDAATPATTSPPSGVRCGPDGPRHTGIGAGRRRIRVPGDARGGRGRSPADRSGPSRRSSAATSCTPTTRAAASTTRCPPRLGLLRLQRRRAGGRGSPRVGPARALRRPRCPSRRRGRGHPRGRPGRDDGLDPRDRAAISSRAAARRGAGGERRPGRSSTSRSSRGTGETGWLGAVRELLPELADAFRPDIDRPPARRRSHAWDPLAHLRVTTTAMGAAARLVHELAHRHARGRWLATGGGGYDVYRVVPRAWAHVWSAAAHRDPSDAGRLARTVVCRGLELRAGAIAGDPR